MRYLVCVLIGLLFGAMLTSMAFNTMARRHALPRGLMNVMQHELGVARRAAQDGSCQQDPSRNAAEHLRLIAASLDPVLLPNGTQDRVLSGYTNDLRKTLAAWDVTAACAQQSEALRAVNHSCDACHRDYR